MNRSPFSILVSGLAIALWLTGCRTPCDEASFAQPFDSQRVSQLAHESFKLAWEARLSCATDLRLAPLRPTHLDWSVLRYLKQISTQVPWIATEVEKHPDAPRCASKFSNDAVTTYASALKAAYQPDSFRLHTNDQIEQLLHNLDEISRYYQLK